MEYSSGIIKPDGVKRCLQKEIFQWMEKSGLKVVFQKTLLLKKKDVRVLYDYCYGMNHYNDLEKFMMSGSVIFYVVESSFETINSLNRLVGSTDPKKSLKETIRGKYGKSIARNVIHSTQNKITLKQELKHFLTKQEMLDIFLK